MADQAGDLRKLAGMALGTGTMIRHLTHEVVRRVAALAIDASVKLAVLRCRLVAAAASPGGRVNLGSAGGVGIVTPNARASQAALRMIGVHRAMALATGLRGAGAHIVRGVATGALLMRRCPGAAQHCNIGVARAAWRGLFLGKLVRAVTPHTLAVAAFE